MQPLILQPATPFGVEFDNREGDSTLPEDLDHGLTHPAVAADDDVMLELLHELELPPDTENAAQVGLEHGACKLSRDEQDDADADKGEDHGEDPAAKRQGEDLFEPDGGHRDGGHVEGIEGVHPLDKNVAEGAADENQQSKGHGLDDGAELGRDHHGILTHCHIPVLPFAPSPIVLEAEWSRLKVAVFLSMGSRA